MSASISFGDFRKLPFHTDKLMFATYFKTKRTAINGLTHDAIAAKLGVTRVAVSNWEHNKNLPDPKKIPLLAEILGVPVGELMRQAYPQKSDMDYSPSDPGISQPPRDCTLEAILEAVKTMPPAAVERIRVEVEYLSKVAALSDPPPSLSKKAKRPKAA